MIRKVAAIIVSASVFSVCYGLGVCACLDERIAR